jgi:hypothetical protein
MTIHARENIGTLVPTLTRTKPSFYIASTNKLTVMYWLTFELYFFYWVYKNWKTYQAATNTMTFPLTRTFLGIFFIYSLFRKIDQQLKAARKTIQMEPTTTRKRTDIFVDLNGLFLPGPLWRRRTIFISANNCHLKFLLLIKSTSCNKPSRE